MTYETHTAVFRRAAARVAVVGAVTVLAGLAAGVLAGGSALSGARWGTGAGTLMTAITVAALAYPWDRHPLLATGGVMLSFLGKIITMVGVVVLAGPRKDSLSPGWFLATLALVLLPVTVTEILVLARGRALTVEPPGGSEES
ncbi:hypothetical protein [Actinomyces howellii]|uniref:ATP synthase I chain n=1 Tax=Actinomyces howellii TaxID=52771 RepID=A0A3S4V439_9ACTO|nr:hypothetical protein [Actinomyces howellii]VEG27351.1 Uncharacterised protein [Actinomyces howellii]